jgi:hypothetical protein
LKRSLNLLFLVFIVLFLSCECGQAQDSSAVRKDYSASPEWIHMMNDPNTNYYEALKAFDEYWKGHAMPVLEEEEEMEGGDSGEMKREQKERIKKDENVVLTEQQIKVKNEDELMKYNVKRFERWKRDVFPFVQEDGRILTDEERQKIWLQQQEELKNQNK